EVQTFLKALPEDATDRPVVARVELVFAEYKDSILDVRAKVIEPIKGTKPGDEINIRHAVHSCMRDYNVKAGDVYYIAGDINDDGLFHGLWQGMGEKYGYRL